MNSVERSIHRFGVPEIAKIIQTMSESSVKAMKTNWIRVQVFEAHGNKTWKTREIARSQSSPWGSFGFELLQGRLLPVWRSQNLVVKGWEYFLQFWKAPFPMTIYSPYQVLYIYTMFIHFLLDFARSSVGCKKINCIVTMGCVQISVGWSPKNIKDLLGLG